MQLWFMPLEKHGQWNEIAGRDGWIKQHSKNQPGSSSMGEKIMTDVQPYLHRIMERLSKPDVQASLKGFNRLLLFRFTDINEDWLIRVVDGKDARLEKNSQTDPDVTVTITSDVLAGIMDHKLNALKAYMQHKIQTKGAMEDLVKMQKLLL
jgi:putative sterol carrier protein